MLSKACLDADGKSILPMPALTAEEKELLAKTASSLRPDDALVGIDSFWIQTTIADMEASAIPRPLTLDRIQSEAELAFRRNGIPIAYEPNSLTPRVDIGVLVAELSGTCSMYSVHVAVWDHRFNPMFDEMKLTKVWEFDRVLGIVPTNQTPSVVQESLHRKIEAFANDYLKANPKE